MKRIPFARKLLVCFIASLIASIAIVRILLRTAWELLDKWTPAPRYAIIAVALFLISAISYSFFWQKKDKKQQINSIAALAFWQGIIRYFIAIDLSMIGWQKLFHLQFSTPLGILDEPFSSFSGEALTWAYFGHSYTFTCVIGLLQIVGSYLLLFKRTTLFGAVVIFPLLLNIILIDYFYELDAGELGHAIILMTGILYLLMAEYHRLFEFFFLAKSSLFSLNLKNPFLKIIIRFSVVCVPLLLIMAYGSRDKNPQLTGKYKVKSLIRNQEILAPVSCQDSVLTIIYFDQGNDIVFEYNSQSRRMLGSYSFNQGSRALKAWWRYPLNKNDTLFATLSQIDKQNQLTIIGKMGKDSLRAVLLKVK